MALFSVALTPRFYETDALGHIGNTAITAWFEVARTRLLEHLGAHEGMPSNWVLASVSIDYLDETFYGTDVDIGISAISVGNTSLTIDCEMRQDGRCTVRGRAVLVHFDVSSKTKLRLPDALRAAVAAMQG